MHKMKFVKVPIKEYVIICQNSHGAVATLQEFIATNAEVIISEGICAFASMLLFCILGIHGKTSAPLLLFYIQGKVTKTLVANKSILQEPFFLLGVELLLIIP